MTIKTGIPTHRPRVSLVRFTFCWWRHIPLPKTSQWPDNYDANTWQVISNSLDIDFIHGDIHGRSCKKRVYEISTNLLHACSTTNTTVVTVPSNPTHNQSPNLSCLGFFGINHLIWTQRYQRDKGCYTREAPVTQSATRFGSSLLDSSMPLLFRQPITSPIFVFTSSPTCLLVQTQLRSI